MIKSTFIYGSTTPTTTKQKVFHDSLYNTKPDFSSTAQQEYNKQVFGEEFGHMLSTSPPLLMNMHKRTAQLVHNMVTLNDITTTINTPSNTTPTTPSTLTAITPLTTKTQASSNNISTTTEHVIDSEDDDNDFEEGRVEEVSDDELFECEDDNVQAEVIDNYEEDYQRELHEYTSLAEKMFALLMDSEIKFNLGKFNDCYNDCLKAEEIGMHINAQPLYLAQ
jgi:hypothetical protein